VSEDCLIKGIDGWMEERDCFAKGTEEGEEESGER
jgi:hypothetical protein